MNYNRNELGLLEGVEYQYNKDGSINWNFVDADLYGAENRPNCDKEYYATYESLAIQYDLANGVIA